MRPAMVRRANAECRGREAEKPPVRSRLSRPATADHGGVVFAGRRVMLRGMKLAATYGALMAIANAILLLVLFFAGLHDNAERLSTAQWVGVVGGVAISVTGLALTMREKRAQYPAEEEWGYGSALGGGVLAGVVASFLGMVTAALYFGLINPGFSDVVWQAQSAAMEAKGVSAAQIEKIEPMVRKWISPVALTIIQGISGVIWSVVLALVVAIFFRRRPAATGGADAPPPLG